MTKKNWWLYLIESGLIAWALVENFWLIPCGGELFTVLFRPLIWWIIGLVLYSWLRKSQNLSQIKNKFVYVMAFALLNLTTIYVLGFFTGFVYSAYAKGWSVLKNVYALVSILIPFEMIRNVLISRECNRFDRVFNWLTMVLITIDLNQIVKLSQVGLPLSNLIGDLIPVLIAQFFLNYLMRHCGLRSTCLWQLLPATVEILMPILPNLSWFFKFLLAIMWPLITFIFLYYNYTDQRLAREIKIKRRRFPYGTLTLMVMVFLMVGFITGMFGIKPTAIVSNSMNPYFERGDVVVIRAQANYEINSVIQFNYGKIKVVHRIIDKQKDSNGKTYFITKGDNNNTADEWNVYPEQIDGIVQMIIPKIGYLAVWVDEIFNGRSK